MKLIYRTNIYHGPETIEEIIKLAKGLNKKGWATKIYDPRKDHGYGPALWGFSGQIFGLNKTLSDDENKFYSILLGEIKPGRIETHDRDKSLEDFLANYQFKKFEKVEEIK